ncbi:leucyl aminopeptidase [Allorhizocola rhizosphaerae]|uniref:leucyl aminopeptidase n=1 Tax=Allorhizocola rhizosphaerae TaxID=1872709 RepID=UPI000E3D252C|nr:leucyl aminopeptidase [Allorhizocola rhizosphaerae]
MRPEIRVLGQTPRDVDVVGTVAAAPWDEPEFLAAVGFSGKAGETVTLPGAPMRVVVGEGDARRMGAAFARAVKRHRSAAFVVPDGCPAGTFAEAFLLASYRFTKYKSAAEEPALQRLDLVTSQDAAGVQRARVVAQAVALARDLVNEPGGVLTPDAFAQRAVDVAAAGGLACEVWDEERIAGERLGGLLGVARGSTQPPRLVRLAYRPASHEATIALVGKGITFDSGGLSMKPTNFMVDMKYDMAGAAAVLGAMSVLRDLACPTAATAWLPLTDNMSGGDATRLGDVLRTRNGITIEVRNADAEGRLILADALALAAEEAPDSIVDIATLTDAVPMVIGRRYGGLAGNDEAWVARVRAAAERAGELVWQMPLDGVERKMLDSKVADVVNATGQRYGQSAVAALFLKEFVPDGLPWAHLDIAGPAFADEDDGEWTAGGTGYGVRTLIELLSR